MSIHRNTEFLIVCLYPSNSTTIGCDWYYPYGFCPYVEMLVRAFSMWWVFSEHNCSCCIWIFPECDRNCV